MAKTKTTTETPTEIIKLEDEAPTQHPPTPEELFFETTSDIVFDEERDDDILGVYVTLDLENCIPMEVDEDNTPSNTHCLFMRSISSDEQIQTASDTLLAWASSLQNNVATQVAPEAETFLHSLPLLGGKGNILIIPPPSHLEVPI